MTTPNQLAQIKVLATAAQVATEAAFRRKTRQYDDAGNAAFVAFQRVANPETVLGLITKLEATQNALDKALGQQAGKDMTDFTDADLAEARRIAETAVSDIWAATQKALAEDIAAALARVRQEEREKAAAKCGQAMAKLYAERDEWGGETVAQESRLAAYEALEELAAAIRANGEPHE